MKTAWTLLALVAAVQAQKKGVQSPVAAPIPNDPKSQGCFSSAGDWEKVTVESGMSMGACTDECVKQKLDVSALNGADCYCGSNYPPVDDLVDDKKCNYPCPGYDWEACGGISGGKFYSVFNSGLEMAVEYKEEEEKASSTSSASTAQPTESESESSNTETVATQQPSASRASQEEDDSSEDDGGPSMGGIIGGVVAGVAVLAIGAGIGFWIFRRRRNFDIEEEHRRNAAVNSFISGGKPPSSSGGLSMTDSRMEPTLGNRRMSDGSIADNHDYSRKILRVTNA